MRSGYVALDPCIDSLLTPAAHGMPLEVCRRALIGRVEVAFHAFVVVLAFGGSTREEMVFATAVVLDQHLGLE